MFVVVFPVRHFFGQQALPQPLLYQVAHGLKIAGGLAGGVVGSRRKATEAEA